MERDHYIGQDSSGQTIEGVLESKEGFLKAIRPPKKAQAMVFRLIAFSFAFLSRTRSRGRRRPK
jgi:hypothetical protein